MDIYTLIDFYVNEKTSIKRLEEIVEAYRDLLNRMSFKSSAKKKREIAKTIKNILIEIEKRKKITTSYRKIIEAYIGSFEEKDITEVLRLIEEKINLLDQPIQLTEGDLEEMKHRGHFADMADMRSLLLIKPSLIPDEYQEKRRYLTSLLVRQEAYQEIKEIIELHHKKTTMKP